MNFKNIKEAHTFYKYPGSYQYGSIYVKDYGIIRSYSNGSGKDFFKGKLFYQKKKMKVYYSKFLENKQKNELRLFVKEDGKQKIMGYVKSKVTKDFVSLKIQ